MSEVVICNLALSHIGASGISNLSEPSKEAQECNLLYGPARDATLRDHNWAFARKRITLALNDESYSGWDYAYEYPIDCIVEREIYNPASKSEKVEYEVTANSDLNGLVILTNQADAVLIYTAKVENTTVFDSLFKDALSWRLAADLSQPIKGKPQLVQLMMQQYMFYLSRAVERSANQGYNEPTNESSFTKARG